jgi:membrane-bound serine protease (ClpP class)
VTIALWVIGLMVIGVILMVIEVLVIPGFGLIGVLGGIAMLAACWIAFSYSGAGYGALSVVAGLLSSGLVFWVLPKTSSGKKMVLNAAIDNSAADPSLRGLLDREGVAMSDLRPSGAVKIDGRPVDVVTEGEYVERGTKVRVVRVEGARVVVEPTT